MTRVPQCVRLPAAIADHQLAAAAATAQETGQQSRASFSGAGLPLPVLVIRHHLLNFCKLFPAHVALMRAGNQGPPLIFRFTPAAAAAWCTVFVTRGVLGLAIS